MTEKELLKKYNVTLREFSSEQWTRNGFFDSVNRIVYINADLPAIERRKVLLHELGHLEHYKNLYENVPILCENEANRSMIRQLVKEAVENLENIHDFNYLNFMEYYNLKTTTDEIMVKEEYLNLVG